LVRFSKCVYIKPDDVANHETWDRRLSLHRWGLGANSLYVSTTGNQNISEETLLISSVMVPSQKTNLQIMCMDGLNVMCGSTETLSQYYSALLSWAQEIGTMIIEANA